MKKWQCTVCGYIHTGDEPPDVCPVCGADKTQFIELIEETQPPAAPASTKQQAPRSSPPTANAQSVTLLDRIHQLMIKHHLHPISVHVPNGMVPAIIVFVFLSLIFHAVGLSKAAFYNMVFILLSLPVVLYSGYNEWKENIEAP